VEGRLLENSLWCLRLLAFHYLAKVVEDSLEDMQGKLSSVIFAMNQLAQLMSENQSNDRETAMKVKRMQMNYVLTVIDLLKTKFIIRELY
jgi:hypothetical protein